MIWLVAYVVGLAFLLGTVVGEGGRPTFLEVVTVALWPVAIPVAVLCGWWTRRQRRRWNALTLHQRRLLNEEGKGVMADRWPYVYTPWVPRGMRRGSNPVPTTRWDRETASMSEEGADP